MIAWWFQAALSVLAVAIAARLLFCVALGIRCWKSTADKCQAEAVILGARAFGPIMDAHLSLHEALLKQPSP